MGGWGGQNVPPAIQFADILLLTINYTSPPSFIQIGPKLLKFVIGVVSGWVGPIMIPEENLPFQVIVLVLGSGLGRGRSPVEWGDFPSVRPYVCPPSQSGW